MSRYELKRAEYVTKLPKGKHSVKGDTAAFVAETSSLLCFVCFSLVWLRWVRHVKHKDNAAWFNSETGW